MRLPSPHMLRGYVQHAVTGMLAALEKLMRRRFRSLQFLALPEKSALSDQRCRPGSVLLEVPVDVAAEELSQPLDYRIPDLVRSAGDPDAVCDASSCCEMPSGR